MTWKPANIKLTSDGVAASDFGSRRCMRRTALERSCPRCDDGGDAGWDGARNRGVYEPEQARGQAVDKRSDIWAFGCVVFEMLAGRIAFAGDTDLDRIAAILDRQPEWSVPPAATPIPIRRLLRRCSRRMFHSDWQTSATGGSRSTTRALVTTTIRKPYRLRDRV